MNPTGWGTNIGGPKLTPNSWGGGRYWEWGRGCKGTGAKLASMKVAMTGDWRSFRSEGLVEARCGEDNRRSPKDDGAEEATRPRCPWRTPREGGVSEKPNGNT